MFIAFFYVPRNVQPDNPFSFSLTHRDALTSYVLLTLTDFYKETYKYFIALLKKRGFLQFSYYLAKYVISNIFEQILKPLYCI